VAVFTVGGDAMPVRDPTSSRKAVKPATATKAAAQRYLIPSVIN